MIDFTVADAMRVNVPQVLKKGIAVVTGTTGLSAEERSEMGKLAEANNTSMFHAANYAIGAVLMMKFAAEAAKYMPHVEVIELHHDKKLDALEDIIESANRKPILVAYWFKHDYQRIVARLNQIGVKYMKIKTRSRVGSDFPLPVPEELSY